MVREETAALACSAVADRSSGENGCLPSRVSASSWNIAAISITGPDSFLRRVRGSAGALANPAGDKAPGWSNHHVVLKEAMVYGALAGPSGIATSACKQIWNVDVF